MKYPLTTVSPEQFIHGIEKAMEHSKVAIDVVSMVKSKERVTLEVAAMQLMTVQLIQRKYKLDQKEIVKLANELREYFNRR